MNRKSHPVNTFLRSDVPNQFNLIPISKYQYRTQLVVPDEFNGMEVWKHLLVPPTNQGSCGACWAFATVSTLSDRFNIQSKGQLKIVLSPTKPILCSFENISTDRKSVSDLDFEAQFQFKNIEDIQSANVTALMNGACMGNTLYDAWKKLYLLGSNPITCVPYNDPIESGRTDFLSLDKYEKVSRLPLCSDVSGTFGDMCADVVFDPVTKQEYGTPAKFYRCLHFYTVPGIVNGSEYDIRKDIYLWGPVSTGMDIYEDFYKFNSTSIYSWDGTSEKVGGHAIEIVGWGIDGDTKYWWVKNSWGENWGINGYFRIVRGVNMCGIEENVIAPVPDFFYSLDYNVPDFNIWSEESSTKTERTKITSNAIRGGGINPELGYSRRILSTKPWIDNKYNQPLVLPKWNEFVAGTDCVYQPPPPQPWYNNKYQVIMIIIYITLIIGFIALIKLYFM